MLSGGDEFLAGFLSEAVSGQVDSPENVIRTQRAAECKACRIAQTVARNVKVGHADTIFDGYADECALLVVQAVHRQIKGDEGAAILQDAQNRFTIWSQEAMRKVEIVETVGFEK